MVLHGFKAQALLGQVRALAGLAQAA